VPYQLFDASDRPFVLAVGNDAQWQRCCEAIDQPTLATDPRFATNADRVANRAELVPLLQAVFVTHPAATWLDRLQPAQVPCGLVNTLPDVFDDPQVRQQEITTPVEHRTAGVIEMLAPPWSFSASPADVRLPPPLLGQHTTPILAALGYDSEQIDRWRDAGVV
jgi:crotonobetainyl-CoA:carnitine CoA-transferase CaiB-like acyl-CoA transferase